jgi:hypothetical protein
LVADLIHCPIGANEGEKIFSLKIKPLLESKCFACHSQREAKIKGGLDLTSLKSILIGGETSDQILVPGNPQKSLLFTAIQWADPDYEMPPKENDRLSPKQIEWFSQWIKLGAPWPNSEIQKKYLIEERSELVTKEGIILKTTGGLSEDWTYRRYKPEDVWAFLPIKKTIARSKENPIDFFINERWKQQKITPAPRADFRTLVKRAYHDLHGLPPTPYQIYQFRLEWEKMPKKAWENLIDQLLASSHFGERSGQHWLDVTRYADTAGFSNDYERSNMWRYRDYVIRSFNDDKPYDQFIIEQIAGDEIWEGQKKQEKDPELLVATSFLRMGPWDPAMVLKPQARQLYLDDVVNSVGQTFLSTTMRCFKCHDHKFDPFTG